ncbi:MAG TPA: hypothetical protein VHZ95_10365 [Polyangiales bacterium]|nr:hypothetical protein [Polyangiales bacterium]
MRALILDRAQPRIERIAERSLVIDSGGEVARLDLTLRDAVLGVRVFGFAPRAERADVDASARVADA